MGHYNHCRPSFFTIILSFDYFDYVLILFLNEIYFGVINMLDGLQEEVWFL